MKSRLFFEHCIRDIPDSLIKTFNEVHVSRKTTVKIYYQSLPLKITRRVSLNFRANYSSDSWTPLLIRKGDVTQISKGDDSQVVSHVHSMEFNFESEIRDLESSCTKLCQDTLPSEIDVEKYLKKCMNVAQSLALSVPSLKTSKAGAASTLLALNNSKPEQSIFRESPEVDFMSKSISDLVYSVIKHPNVFISPRLLKMYVAVQSALGRPNTLPEAFQLYSHKSVPIRNTSPIRYSKPNPNMFMNAIPQDVAKAALEAAIKARQLVVAIDIIEAAYISKAFKASKLVRQALLPASLLTVTPFAIYTLASQLSSWQTSMDPNFATNVAFLGMMAYIGLTGTVGFIAISTSNDHMNRITWAPGVPLRQRWIREDERAAIDQVACAWGFHESWRRGEEEGEEWDLIKEWVSRRAMILDRVELMEGMN